MDLRNETGVDRRTRQRWSLTSKEKKIFRRKIYRPPELINRHSMNGFLLSMEQRRSMTRDSGCLGGVERRALPFTILFCHPITSHGANLNRKGSTSGLASVIGQVESPWIQRRSTEHENRARKMNRGNAGDHFFSSIVEMSMSCSEKIGQLAITFGTSFSGTRQGQAIFTLLPLLQYLNPRQTDPVPFAL